MPYDVAELRRRKGLSQRELAKALGVSHGAIGNIEAEIGGVSLPLARRIARFFGVPLDEIRFPGDERTPSGEAEQRPASESASREEAVW